MLVTLIKIIDEVGIDRDVEIGTKGRLLNKFVSQLVQQELKRSQMLSEHDVVFFLSQLACTARLHKLRNAIQLGREGSTQRTALVHEQRNLMSTPFEFSGEIANADGSAIPLRAFHELENFVWPFGYGIHLPGNCT